MAADEAESEAPRRISQQSRREPKPSKEEFYPPERIEKERNRLRRFYELFAPDKLPKLDKNIKKYSRTPDGFSDMWDAIRQLYDCDIENVLRIIDSGGDISSQTVTAQTTQRQPVDTEPTTSSSTAAESASDEQRVRLYRFFSKYAPQKIGDVASMVTKYADPATGGYARMWQQLVERYGPELEDTARSLAALFPKPSDCPGRKYAPDVREKWRQRLRQFFEYYAPEKGPADIEDVLDRYGPPDGYDRMWRELTVRYGVGLVEPASGLVKRVLSEEEEAERQRLIEIFGPPAREQPEERMARIEQPAEQTNEKDHHRANSDSPLLRALSESSGGAGASSRADHHPYSPLGVTAIAVILHALLRLQGTTVMLYEKASEVQQREFRRAVELEVALNLGIERRQVSVLTVNGGMSIELAIELTHEQVQHGVGDALVTKVLMGTFTVRHIRESYRRDLGGNPIQLHTEGAAIYGGSCTPMFNEKAHIAAASSPPGENFFKASTSAVAAQWDTLTRDASQHHNTTLRGTSLLSSGAANNSHALLQSPTLIVSPQSEATGGGSIASPAQPLLSPLRTWNTVDSTISDNDATPKKDNHELRRNHASLMNPHGLRSSPAKQHTDLVPGGSFLGRIWGDEALRGPPIQDTRRPPPSSATSAPVAPLSQAVPPTERAWREMAKPTILNPNPSTDDVPLPTRTAPPTVTRFDPTAAVEVHTQTSTALKRENERRFVEQRHVQELLESIRAPNASQPARTPPVQRHLDFADPRLPPSHELAAATLAKAAPVRQTSNSKLVLMPTYDAVSRREAETNPRRAGVHAPSQLISRDFFPDAKNDAADQTKAGYAPQYLMDIVEALEL